MNFIEMPTEIQKLIFQHSYPSDLLNIIQNIPEWNHLITSDVFRIVSNDLPSVKLKYGLPDDFYLEYKCNIDPNVDRDTSLELLRDYIEIERNNSVLDPYLLMGFKGAILFEINDILTCLTKFDDHLLLHDPIELVWNTTRARKHFRFFHDFFPTLDHITRLKKLTIFFGTEMDFQEILDEPYEIQNLPHRIPSNKLHIPVVKSLHLGFEEIRGIGAPYEGLGSLGDELGGYSIKDIKTIMPNLKSLNMSFEDVYENYEDGSIDIAGLEEGLNISYEKSQLDYFFETIEGSLDFLKDFQLRYFHNEKFDLFKNLQVSNLENLVIDSSTIHSIKNLDLPNVKSFRIKKSAIYEISNLKLNSLEEFSIDIKPTQFTFELEEEDNEVHVTIQNIKSSSLKSFTLLSSFRIEEISNLEFPYLQSLSIWSGNDFNGSFEGIINSSFPKLENITLRFIPLDNLYALFQGIPNLKNIHIASCPSFNITKIGSQNSLETLSLGDIELFQGFDGISLPTLRTMRLEAASGETPLSMENCTFENLKTLTIYTEFIFNPVYCSTLTFLNNNIPQLEKLSLSGFDITNHFSTEPYPNLKEISISRIESIQISQSDKLKILDLSENYTTMNINKSDKLPNLNDYRKPMMEEDLDLNDYRKPMMEEDLETILKKRKIELGEGFY
ncbi:Internalin-I [Wickerhamomyces ciferrii]|uniref:Internalin-I n=1 Tax=Wickerhamomyces ciferrii (strain ATCC 14091 / BCRC 22168 / CBS 111 / JCM 3599 / NBRC 0793 / NRRL Y-1031 F-60-10) TaxID=1206466 RepID=K0KIE1_WICCF|nr:Internalin-I [Wickerhamomyces ciferrii]CCH41164.1 Internalin-I [Wickerhamomyces ciferrii]